MPPALGHRREPFVFQIGEPQSLAQALGVLDHRDRERPQAADGIGLERERRLEFAHVGVTCEQWHPAEHRLEQSNFRHHGQHRHRMLGQQELDELHTDTLTRQLFEAGASGDAGGDPCRVERALSIGGMKAKEAQDAQVVFGDARGSVADEAHAPRLDVGEPADIVIDRAIAGGGQRVDGEVTALGIALPIASKRHLGMPTEGLDVFAQGGDFERPPEDHHGHGAVLDSGGHRLEARRLSPANHFGR